MSAGERASCRFLRRIAELPRELAIDAEDAVVLRRQRYGLRRLLEQLIEQGALLLQTIDHRRQHGDEENGNGMTLMPITPRDRMLTVCGTTAGAPDVRKTTPAIAV
jgi:hypothetical protein